ncbi:hypothetical protein CAC42_4495 [Sphaceloma murrayae]|uniref:Ribosomal protein S17 n=1 Tax=Sphaceloma murrayae TaxID=2082308 RepID=A0A2K1QLR4_9PEZI|nr:hypothetical protein CAC42_4495 [Sphaceloma murrayae]
MATIPTPCSRMALSVARSQCPRPAILAWRNSRRFLATTVNTSPAAPSEPLAASLLSKFPKGPPTSQSQGTKSPQKTQQHKKPTKSPTMTGKVTSVGLMPKTVRVDRSVQEWHRYLRKYYKATKHYLVHDPANSLRMGDVISFGPLPGRTGDNVSNVVREILVPFGQEIGERPPVPTLEMLEEHQERQRSEKRERRETRRKAEAGDQEAKMKVIKEGIAVRDFETGKGKAKTVTKILQRDMVTAKR